MARARPDWLSVATLDPSTRPNRRSLSARSDEPPTTIPPVRALPAEDEEQDRVDALDEPQIAFRDFDLLVPQRSVPAS